jgi:molybdate transport system substrate-binding protein
MLIRSRSAAWARVALLAGLVCLVQVESARAEELNVAVAANFLGTLQRLAPLFEQATGHKLVPSPGSTGQLYAQIQRGAPYDVLLSADAERPAKLEAEGLTLPGSRFTYAIGRLVLWSPKPGVVDAKGEVLKKQELRFVALADPKTAPYGAAAEQALSALKLLEPLRAAKKLVYGESAAQAQQFASTGHAELGFLALAQITDVSGKTNGSLWLVPESLYKRLDQDAVVLKASSKQALAQQFLKWLRNDKKAVDTMRASGYTLPK